MNNLQKFNDEYNPPINDRARKIMFLTSLTIIFILDQKRIIRFIATGEDAEHGNLINGAMC